MTGGTRGIGFAVAEVFARRGYGLIVTYGGDDARAGVAVDRLRECGAPVVEAYRVDQRDVSAAGRLVEVLGERVSHLGVVVLNAGVTLREPFGEIVEGHWVETFNANVHFPVFFLQRVADRLPAGACVVLTGSLMGIEPHGTSLAYGVSKSATHALVKNLVKFLAPLGVRVNGVAPGFVDTQWQVSKPAQVRASIESKVGLGRFARPSEIASAYAFVVDNSYVNGEIVVVDGGYSFR